MPGSERRENHDRWPPYEPPTFDTGRPLIEVTDVAAALEGLDREG